MTAVPFAIDRPQIVHAVVCNVISAMVPTCDRCELFNRESRRGAVVAAWMRQVAMYIMVRRFEFSIHQFAALCHRSRPTVRHGVSVVEEAGAANELTSAFLAFVEALIRAALAELEAAEAETGRLPAEYENVGDFHG